MMVSSSLAAVGMEAEHSSRGTPACAPSRAAPPSLPAVFSSPGLASPCHILSSVESRLYFLLLPMPSDFQASLSSACLQEIGL